MKSREEKSIKTKLVDYIQTVNRWRGDVEEFDWRIYEGHKKKIDKICDGDWRLYSWAIEKLTEKLGI